MKFLNYNLSSQNETTVTSSTADVDYPATNLKHDFRSKKWMSAPNGAFVIDNSNNEIDFEETISVELTATLVPGTYNAATLATEISTKMDAAGANTYTVQYSQATGLWTVSSSGAYFSLLCNSGTNQSKNTFKKILGFTNSDKTGALTYTGTNIAIHTEEWVTFDAITSEPVDTIALFWPKESGIKLSDSAIVKVQANATNNWSAPAINVTMTIDNDYMVASHLFSTDQSYRFWRVSIIDPSNAYLQVELGVFYVGKSLTVQDADNGFTFTTKDTSKTYQNDFGNMYVDEYPMENTLDLDFTVLQYQEAKTIENAYRQNGLRKPVLVILDPTEIVFSKNHFLVYGKMTKPVEIKQVSYDIFNTSLVIREIS